MARLRYMQPSKAETSTLLLPYQALLRSGGAAGLNVGCGPCVRAPLHRAVLGGKRSAAQVLLLAGADVNVRDVWEDSPLHLAVLGAHGGLVKDLLLSGADHSTPGSSGARPIDIAAQRGHDGMVLDLLRKGAGLDCLDHDVAPLHRAVQGGHISTVKVILAGGANVNCRAKVNCWTPLHFAGYHNVPCAIQALIEGGAYIEARAKKGETPLLAATAATRTNSCAAVVTFLELGANVNAKNLRGWTALHTACHVGQPEVADLLLRRGADEMAITSNGSTPSSKIPAVGQAFGDDRLRLQRLSKLLVRAPQDRVWRRRGYLVMCRTYPDRARLLVGSRRAGEHAGHGKGRPHHRSRRERRVKVEVEVGGASSNEARAGARVTRLAEGQATTGGNEDEFNGLLAWLMASTDDIMFQKLVGFV